MKTYQDEAREYVDSDKGQDDPRVTDLNNELNGLIQQRTKGRIAQKLFWQRMNDAVYRFAEKVGIV